MMLILTFFSITNFLLNIHPSPPGPSHLYGAWQLKKDNLTTIKIYTPTYFIYSVFDPEGKIFSEAGGGTWSLSNTGIVEHYEFNTSNPDLISSDLAYTFITNHEETPLRLMTEKNNIKTEEVWMKVDEGKSPLFGSWRITQRERNGQMSVMQQGPRKTMKVLSGTRFQWAAFNVETKEFSGTGGGTFTAVDGKYTENIEFFSRDNSRVGASLEFDFKVSGKDWHHKGLSSRGEPIYEIWSNQD